MQHVEHRVNVPHLRVSLQGVYLLLGLLGQLAPELTECLELVDELIDDLPEPLVGELQVDRDIGGKNIVEQLAVVVVTLEALIDGWPTLNPGIYMPEVELPVKVEKDWIV